MQPAMEISREPITRADLDELGARLRADIEQSARELRADFSHVDRTVAGVRGELRMLKWGIGLGLAAIVGGFGILYQGITDLRSDMADLRSDMHHGQTALREEIADLRSDMHRGQTALREEIADLGERTARLEEGQRHNQQQLAELIGLANARALPPDADGASGSPS